MLGNDAMEFLKTLHKLDDIWNEVEDAEYNDRQLTQFAERYHEHKLKLLGIADVSGMLPDEVPNLFVTLAQQIHYESVINGLDMTSIIECFNELQETYKKNVAITANGTQINAV